MDLHEHLKMARLASSKAARQRKDAQLFELDWRSTGTEYLVGWTAVCALLGMKESSLTVRLSQHKNRYSVLRVNPTSGVEDVLTVSRVSQAKAKPRRGRPAPDIDWDRLGPEAPGYPAQPKASRKRPFKTPE